MAHVVLKWIFGRQTVWPLHTRLIHVTLVLMARPLSTNVKGLIVVTMTRENGTREYVIRMGVISIHTVWAIAIFMVVVQNMPSIH